MVKDFPMGNDNVIVNFTAKYCDSLEKLLYNNSFERFHKSYLNRIHSKKLYNL